MIQKVFMPKLGQTMEEATIERWIKKEGERVERGDVLLEITTDKATLEVESYASGVLRKILAAEGEVLPVNAVIALVGEVADELPSEEELKAMKPEPVGAPAKKEAEPDEGPVVSLAPVGRIAASPRARLLAEKEKINLSLLRGSGPNGRIVEEDVLQYVARLRELKATPVARELARQLGVDITAVRGTGPGGRVTKEDVLAAKTVPAAAVGGKVELAAMRRIVAERMSRSKSEIPHYYLSVEVDMTDAVALRTQLNAQGAVKIAYTDMLAKACAKALSEQPQVNAVWHGDSIRLKAQCNVGIAVALEEGLIVPVVRDVDRKSLAQVAAESKSLVEKARGKRLTPDEYEGGSLTISNLGMFGVDNFVPIINPGESVILGVGRIREKPVVLDGDIHIRSMMWLTLSADHRVIDGAVGAGFLQRVKELMEKPSELVS